MNRFMLPKEAFSEYGKSSQLTLMIREAGTGSSAQKQQDNQMGVLTEQLRKNLFQQGFESKPDMADHGLAETTKYAQQKHALLNSQSFSITALPTTLEGGH